MEKESFRDDVYEYVTKKYDTDVEFLWFKYPNYAVFRKKTGKWYGIIMDVPYKKLGIEKEGFVDVLDVKIGKNQNIEELVCSPGFLPAYHMNKRKWVSILLDGTVEENKIYEAIDVSFKET